MEPAKSTEEVITPQKIEIISPSIESLDEQDFQESQILQSEPLQNRSQVEELQVKRHDPLDHSLSARTQTNLSTSPTSALSKESLAEKQLSTIIQALEKAGLDDDYIM